MLIFCWLLPGLVKIDATRFEVKVTNRSQDIFEHYYAIRVEKKNFIFFLKKYNRCIKRIIFVRLYQ